MELRHVKFGMEIDHTRNYKFILDIVSTSKMFMRQSPMKKRYKEIILIII
jgi:hypothetical protein